MSDYKFNTFAASRSYRENVEDAPRIWDEATRREVPDAILPRFPRRGDIATPVEEQGHDSGISGDSDPWPHVFTRIIAEKSDGEVVVYPADGEQAGMNLVESLEKDPAVRILSVRVVDRTILTGLITRQEII